MDGPLPAGEDLMDVPVEVVERCIPSVMDLPGGMTGVRRDGVVVVFHIRTRRYATESVLDALHDMEPVRLILHTTGHYSILAFGYFHDTLALDEFSGSKLDLEGVTELVVDVVTATVKGDIAW
jgi:hypothetical protein